MPGEEQLTSLEASTLRNKGYECEESWKEELRIDDQGCEESDIKELRRRPPEKLPEQAWVTAEQ